VRAGRFPYGLVNDLTCEFTREGVKVSGTMMGGLFQDDFTLTASTDPVETAPVPILGNQVSIYQAASWAGLDAASALDRTFRASWQVSNRWGVLWPINAANTSFGGTAELAPKIELKLLLAADATGMALLPMLRAGTQTWFRIKAVGAEIETAKPYLFQIDGAYGVTTVSEFRDEAGVYATEWTLEPFYDATATKTVEVLVRNILEEIA
jgi:hypothetical protein